MGYCYDHRNRLCCDACGNAGGVRKRICTATVLTDSLRGPRSTLRYCSPPALCPTCYRKRGSAAGIHADCAEYAANAQQEYDAIEAALDAGESLSISAWGSWHPQVPDGMVGLCFASRNGNTYALVYEHEYHNRSVALSTVHATPWTRPQRHPRTT
jgi:hypothetical protein